MSVGSGPLVIPPQIEVAVVVHSRVCAPAEACGLLARDAAGRISMAYPLDNADRSPGRFTVEAHQHFGAVMHAERHGWEIGGVFHSHPRGPAVPSPIDLAQPHDDSWVHLIVGVEPKAHIRAWRIREGSATELEVETTLTPSA